MDHRPNHVRRDRGQKKNMDLHAFESNYGAKGRWIPARVIFSSLELVTVDGVSYIDSQAASG